jgi:hypothetical protein
MNKFFKFLSGILLLILGLSFAGCSSDSTPTVDITNDEVVEELVFDENELDTELDSLI